jgi:hypothetical protein
MKGPEPEGVEVGAIKGRTYAFIGLERTHQVLVYDVTNPRSPGYVQMLMSDDDEAPEGLLFLGKKDSRNHCPMLLVTN